MKPAEFNQDDEVIRRLRSIRRTQPLNAQAAAEERARFLKLGMSFQAAVSQSQNPRHNGWINQIKLAFVRKENNPMLNALLAVVLSISLFFGGAGATAYAAQTSQPDELLYPVKILSEDTRLFFSAAPEDKVSLTLEFANRRMAEMTSLSGAGKPIPQPTTARLQQELDTALELAAEMQAGQMLQTLEQIRLQAQSHSQQMSALMGSQANQTNPDLVRLQTRLQEQERLAAAGTADPQSFKLQVQERTGSGQPGQNQPSQTPAGNMQQTPGVSPSPAGNSYGPGSGQASATPGQFGPGASQTPLPTGGSNGPGTGAGPGAGQQTATPGGNGSGEPTAAVSCTPVLNGGGSGQGPAPTQTAQPGGSGGSGGNGSGSPNPTATPQPTEDPGAGQPSATPGQGGSGSGEPIHTPQPSQTPGGNGQGGKP